MNFLVNLCKSNDKTGRIRDISKMTQMSAGGSREIVKNTTFQESGLALQHPNRLGIGKTEEQLANLWVEIKLRNANRDPFVIVLDGKKSYEKAKRISDQRRRDNGTFITCSALS